MINKSLETRIENGTLLHAYLLSGPAGSEKMELAKRMAASIVCSGTGKKPCHRCIDCRKAEGGIHPDIITVEKQADKKEILVDQIRDVRSSAAVLPNDAESKVYIINGADQMNVRAQNALLKVLEEPPSFVSFILLAENPGALLETIHSRCVHIKLREEEAVSDTAGGAEAAKLLDTLENGSDLDLCKAMFDLEKLGRNEFADFIEQGYTESIKRMKSAALGGGSPRIYADTAAIFKKCREYTDYNVGNGHICGMLAASFMGLRKKK